MLMQAILTLAARMQHMIFGSDDLEARQYHDHCLQYLIPALSAPEHCYDDNVLTTITLLKFYEELDTSAQSKSHLLGSQRLLNTRPEFCFSGGVAEAASWQLLRATIYECTVEDEPWDLCLDSYMQSSVFDRADDASYANRIIYLVGRLVRFHSALRHARHMEWEEYHALREAVARWRKGRSTSFLPLDHREADLDNDRPLPELWMLSPPAG